MSAYMTGRALTGAGQDPMNRKEVYPMQGKNSHIISPRFRRTLLASAISFALAGGTGLALAAEDDQNGVGALQGDEYGQERNGMAEDQAMIGQDNAGMVDHSDEAAMNDHEQKARDLVGQPLLDQDGEQVGRIDRVVRDEQDELALVVIEEDAGMLGIGEEQERVVSLDELEIEEHASLSQDQDLAQMPEFEEDQYETVAQADDQEAGAPQEDTAELEQPEDDQFGEPTAEDDQWDQEPQTGTGPTG